MYNNSALYDDLLCEATKLAFIKIRTPGRFKYDKSLGEETVEDYKQNCEQQF